MREDLIRRLRGLSEILPKKHTLPSGAETVICSAVAFTQIQELACEAADAIEELQQMRALTVNPVTVLDDKEQKKRDASNADRIRAMSDEELAVFITGTSICELLCGPPPTYCKGRCEEKCLEWLKKEADNGRA